MSRVECKVEECDVEDEDEETGETREIPGVCATCSRCDHIAVAFGTGEKSIKRALMTLKEECPMGQSNFYVTEEEGGESRLPDPVVKPWWASR